MNIAMNVVADSLHVRSGPGTDRASVGFAALKDQLTVTEIDPSGTWGKVAQPAVEGWCSLKYLVPQGADAAPWLAVACSQVGVKEIVNGSAHPRVLEYLATVDDLSTIDKHDTTGTSWCSCFINWCVDQVGIHGTNSAAAQSWRSWRNGKEADCVKPGSQTAAKVGDIAVWERVAPGDWHGHVSIFIAYDQGTDRLCVLGGNQSNAVRYSWYPREDKSPQNYYKLLTLRSV